MPIRPAEAADLPTIVAIYNSTVAGRQVTADLQPVSVDERLHWFDAHQQRHRPMMVLCDEQNHVLAWATFSDYYARAAYDISAEISIYVDESQRGKRLGQTLLDFMLALAPSLGIRNVIAVIFAHNEPSVRMFEKNGFSLWGTLPNVCELDEDEVSVVLLGKRLSST